MYKSIFNVFILIFFFFTFNVSANTAYINIDLLIDKSKAGKYIKSEINKIKNKQINEFKKKEGELKKQEIDLIAKKNILDVESYKNEVIKFQQKVLKYNKYKDSEVRKLNKKNIDSMTKLTVIIKPILTEYASKQNIDLLLDKKNIIIGQSKLDITNDIIILLDKKINKIEIK